MGPGNDISCTVCSVIPLGGAWFVEHGSTRHGPYMADGIAIQVAIGEALMFRRKELAARVSVQDGSGRVSAEYCLCPHFKKA